MVKVEKITADIWTYGEWRIIKLNNFFRGALFAYYSAEHEYFFSKYDYPTIESLCKKLDELEAGFIKTEWDE